MCIDVIVSVPGFLNVNEQVGILRVCARLSAMAVTETDAFVMLATRNGTSKAMYVLLRNCTSLINGCRH